MKTYETLVEALNDLRTQGYTEDFNLKENCLVCGNHDFHVFHDEFQVDRFYRFEDNTSTDDESILYAISSEKYGIKGVLVNAYGIYSDPVANEILDKLRGA